MSGWSSGTTLNRLARKPVGLLNQRDDQSDVDQFIGNLQLDYKFHFLPDLHANLNVGGDRNHGTGTIWPTGYCGFRLLAYFAHGLSGSWSFTTSMTRRRPINCWSSTSTITKRFLHSQPDRCRSGLFRGLENQVEPLLTWPQPKRTPSAVPEPGFQPEHAVVRLRPR